MDKSVLVPVLVGMQTECEAGFKLCSVSELVRVDLCSGFGGCSVSACSGNVSLDLWHFIQKVNNCKFFGFSGCSGCSGKSVENLCKRLWENLWGKSGKGCGKVLEGRILGAKVGISRVLHGLVEKFYHRFSTRVFLCKRRVLHSFHRAYYNYNYFLYRGKEI